MSLLLLFAGAGTETLSGGVTGLDGATVAIEFSPTTDPLDPPVWVDITDRARFDDGVRIKRGRSSELDDFQAGTASFTLDNRDRTFDPTHAAGPYFGDLKPLRRFRIRVQHDSVIYPLFSGFINGWPQTYGGPADVEATVPVSLVDGFGVFALATLFDAEGAFTLDDSDLGVLDEDRLGVSGADDPVDGFSGDVAESLLELINYPDIACDTGLSEVTSDIPTGDLLGQLKQLERSEDGFFYISANGTATFLERTRRQTLARMVTSQATFDDDGTDSRYSDVGFEYDADRLYNDVRRTGTSGNTQSAEDGTSVDSYFRRTHDETLLTTSDAQTRDLAVLFLDRHKDPLVRVPQLTVPVARDPQTLFPAAVGRELLDRVTLRRLPQDEGSVYESEQIVEGITHWFNTKNWTVTLQLSPGFISSWFTLDDSDLGELDDDRLGG